MPVKRYCIPCGEASKPVTATWIVAGEYMCDSHEQRQPRGIKRVSLVQFEKPKDPNPYKIPVEGKPTPVPRNKTSKPASPDGLCSRGCGRPPHRGGCRGMNSHQPDPKPTPLTVPLTLAESALKPMPTFVGAETKTPVMYEHVEPANRAPKFKLLKLESETISIDDIPEVAAPRQKKLGRQGELWAKLESLQPGQVEKVMNRDWAHATTTLNHMLKKTQLMKRVLNHKRSGNLLYLWLEPSGAPREKTAAEKELDFYA